MAYTSTDSTRELSGGEVFICTECGEGFRLYQKLIEHMAIHGLFIPDALSNNGAISSNTHIEFALHENGTLTVVDRSVLSNFTFLFGKPSSKLTWCQNPNKTPNQTTLTSSKMAEKDCAQFRCERCGQLFKSGKSLQLHQQYRVLEKGFRCTLCCKVFNDRESLQSHLQNHAHERFYSCGHCGKRFLRQETLLAHQKQWHGSPSSKTLIRLQEDQENSMEKSYFCKICGLRFFWLSDLQIHQNSHSCVDKPADHAKQQHQIRGDEERKTNAMSQVKNNHASWHPGEKEVDYSKMKRESPAYNGKMCQMAANKQMQSVNPGMPRLRVRRKRSSVSHGKLYCCKHCHRVFLHSSSLSRHMRYHKGTMHACVYCGRRFPQRCDVTRHVALYHSSTLQPMAYESPKTPESSNEQNELQEEIQHSSYIDDEIDSQEKGIPKPRMKYKCKECSIVFGLLSVYKRHLSYHRRAPSKKLLSCPYCPSRFTFRSALSLHIDTHKEGFKKRGTTPANTNVDEPENQHKDNDTGELKTIANYNVPSEVLFESSACSQT